jgi:integrase
MRPANTQNLKQFVVSVIPDSNRKNYLIALNHYARELGHEPTIDELTSVAIQGTLDRLDRLGRSRGTIKKVREVLLAIARRAFELKLLGTVPVVRWQPATPEREAAMPWTISELQMIFGSARTTPGDVAGIPAGRWWTALIATLLSTGTTVREVFEASQASFDPKTGEVPIGLFRHKLHPVAIDAVLSIVPHTSERLLPWPNDGGKPRDILLRRMKYLLFRANLPHVTSNLFERIRITASATPRILDRVNLSTPFTPRPGKPKLARARDRRRRKEELSTVVDLQLKKNSRATQATGELVRITFDGPENLRRFFDESYHPLRLADSPKASVEKYPGMLSRFGWFLACDPTFANLNDETAERWMAWMKKCGLSNATINGQRAMLLALWRHAWRKRKVAEPPRDVAKLKVSKVLPEAWSLEELGKIVNAARELRGDVAGIPAATFWPALILTLYDTGLRIDALMSAKLEAFDADSRWLKIPAKDQKQDADQVFRLSAETAAAVAAMGVDNEFLFPWPYDRNGGHGTLINHYRVILRAAGLKAEKRDLFHKLRRTSGTFVAKTLGRVAAQQHLGHSSPSVTARYVDPRMLDASHCDKLPRPTGTDSER